MKAEQLLTQAENDNGVEHADVKPWHVRAHFEAFDESGKQVNAGTFEQWWWSAQSYRTVWTSTVLNQTDVATGAGLFRSGDARWPTAQEHLVEELLHDPLAIDYYDPKVYDLMDQTQGTGAQALRCLGLVHKRALDARIGTQGPSLAMVPDACFEPSNTALRYMTEPGTRESLLFNELTSFGGRYVAKSIDVKRGGKPWVTAHILDLDTPKDAAAPEAPAGATPLQGPVDLPEGWMHLVSTPEMPPVLGTFVSQQQGPMEFRLKFRVGPNGHVLSAEPEGPSNDVNNSLAKELRKQVFTPFTILGKPVEVNTEYVLRIMGGQGGPGGRAR